MDADVVMEPTAPVQAAPKEASAPTESTVAPVSEPVEEQVAEQAAEPNAEPSAEQGGEQSASGGARRAPRPSQGPPQKGTSLFPTARVAKIIKADNAVDICSKEATFLISVASELLVKHMVDESYTNARLDKRKNLRYDDLMKAVHQNEHLDFLREVVPKTMPLNLALQQREERPQNPELQRVMEAEASRHAQDGEREETPIGTGKPRAVRKSHSKPRSETRPEPEPTKQLSAEERDAQRAARRQSRSGLAEAESSAGDHAGADVDPVRDADGTQDDAPTEAHGGDDDAEMNEKPADEPADA